MFPLFTGSMASTSKKPSRAGIKYCARRDPKPCGVEINPNDPHDRCLRHNITCFPNHQYDPSTCEPCLSIIKGYKDNNKLSRAIFAERITSMQKSFRRVGKTQKLSPDAQARHDVSQGRDIWAPSAKHLHPRTNSVSASPVPPTPRTISPCGTPDRPPSPLLAPPISPIPSPPRVSSPPRAPSPASRPDPGPVLAAPPLHGSPLRSPERRSRPYFTQHKRPYHPSSASPISATKSAQTRFDLPS